MALYHHSIGFPANFQAPKGSFKLRYGPHAMRAAGNDRYGDLTNLLPGELDTTKAKLVEVEMDEGRTVKLVYRVKANRDLDLVIAVCPGEPSWFVRTTWGNRRDDRHWTLQRDRYEKVAA